MNTPLFPADLSTPSLLHAQKLVRQQSILHNDYAALRFVAGVD